MRLYNCIAPWPSKGVSDFPIKRGKMRYIRNQYETGILKNTTKYRQQGKQAVKSAQLHPRNPHQGRYDLDSLCKSTPELTNYLTVNPKGEKTVNFSDEKAVMCLNQALLAHFYKVSNWLLPEGYLCPPIPGRADYIHYLADLLAGCNQGADNVPRGKQVKVLDIGTGANCIYPIIGSQTYGWQFLATDIDPVSVKAAKVIVKSNACLANQVKLQLQKDSNSIFHGMIKRKDRFDLTLCNPPFHASLAEAQEVNLRKRRNLSKGQLSKSKTTDSAKLNFGGQKAELWCLGGEITFLKQMASESVEFAEQVCWFTSLVSKSENIRPLKKWLSQLGARQVEVVQMSQGHKISRLIAWSFLTAEQQEAWAKARWC